MKRKTKNGGNALTSSLVAHLLRVEREHVTRLEQHDGMRERESDGEREKKK